MSSALKFIGLSHFSFFNSMATCAEHLCDQFICVQYVFLPYRVASKPLVCLFVLVHVLFETLLLMWRIMGRPLYHYIVRTDIGANLTDPVYQGFYNGHKSHSPDLGEVLNRGWSQGLQKIIITGGSLWDSKGALDMAQTDERLYCTVGCHPTRSLEFEKDGDPSMYLSGLEELCTVNKGKVVAFGEFGLDYDRTKFAPKEAQIKYFKEQLLLNEKIRLPMFLHNRAAASDFLQIIGSHKSLIEECGGVVHSFDGTEEDVKCIVELGLHIGINGCSLKTEDNLKVVKTIPNDRLMIETDCPWCEVRPRHAGYHLIKTQFPCVKKEKWQSGSMVKSRNEPANIMQVMEILAGIKGEDIHSLSQQIYANTMKVFFKEECL